MTLERTRTGPVLALVCVVQLMVILDASIVNVALRAIRDGLGFSPGGLQWVLNAYSLTFGGLLLLGGRVADLYGRRRALLAGLAVFTLASLAGGLAQGAGQLVAARALQGVGAAVLAPVSLTVITVTFPEGAQRRRALGAWASVSAGGGALGVVLGGVLTETLSWRWVLLVNVPIGLAAFAVAVRVLGESRAPGRPRLDVPGALLATLGTTALVFGIVRTPAHGWSDPVALLALAAGVLLLAVFVAVERHTPSPLVRPGFVAQRPVAVANAVIVLVGAAVYAAFYFASLQVQGLWGYGPLRTGLAFVPFTVGAVAGSTVATRLIARLGPRGLLVPGLLVGAVGMVLFAQLGDSPAFLTTLFPAVLLASFAMGVSVVANTTAATAGVDAGEAGLASGLLNACRMIGGSIGLAVLVTVAARSAGATGYQHAFLVAAAFMAAAAVLAALGRAQ